MTQPKHQRDPAALVLAPIAFDFATAPLPEAQRRLQDLEDICARARATINTRLAIAPRRWTCWSQQHRALVPQSVLAQCHSEIPDGRWIFKDDGALGDDGRVAPAVCCSLLCFKVYQDQSQRMRAEAKGVGTMPPTPPVTEVRG